MPLRKNIIDLYSHGLIDEWLNEPDPQNPEHKPNLPFEGYANDIIGELQQKERQVQKAEALKAEVQTRYGRLKVSRQKSLLIPIQERSVQIKSIMNGSMKPLTSVDFLKSILRLMALQASKVPTCPIWQKP
jgi:hypothetical protein